MSNNHPSRGSPRTVAGLLADINAALCGGYVVGPHRDGTGEWMVRLDAKREVVIDYPLGIYPLTRKDLIRAMRAFLSGVQAAQNAQFLGWERCPERVK